MKKKNFVKIYVFMLWFIFQAESPITDVGEEVEVVMAILRGIYEKRQKVHTHAISSLQVHEN